MPAKELYVNDFSAGLITQTPPHLIPAAGGAAQCDNWDLTAKTGTLTRRAGLAVFKTALTTGAKVVGLHEYVQADTDTFYLAAYNDDVYNVTGGGTWTSIFNSGTMNGAETNFATMNNLAVFVNENITTQSWNGAGASGNLAGTPPANVKYIEKHAQRMTMANSSAGKSRWHYSAVDDTEDWTSTGDTGAGFIDIQTDDGDQITGMASLGNVLFIFKKLSTHAIFGYKPSNFIPRVLSPTIGCVANRTIVKTDSHVIFLSIEGVYVATVGGVSSASDNIQPDIDALTNTVKVGAAAGKLGTQYWLCYDSDADGINDKAYIFDYKQGSWWRYTNIEANVFINTNTGLLYSGGSDDVILRQHDTGTDDSGTAITAVWKSKAYDDDTFVHDKQLHDFHLYGKAASAKTITLDTFINGVDQSDPVTLTMTATDPSASAEYVTLVTNLLHNHQGRLFQFRFTAAATGWTPEIHAFSCMYQTRERQN